MSDEVRRVLSEEEIHVRELRRHAEQVAAWFEELAKTIRRNLDHEMKRAGENTGGYVCTYFDVVASVVKELNVALFNMPLDQLIRDAVSADRARGAGRQAADFHGSVCTGPGVPDGFTCSHPSHNDVPPNAGSAWRGPR